MAHKRVGAPKGKDMDIKPVDHMVNGKKVGK